MDQDLLDQMKREYYISGNSVGNKLLTTLSNMFSDLNLTDMDYKAFFEILKNIKLKENRFGFEPRSNCKNLN